MGNEETHADHGDSDDRNDDSGARGAALGRSATRGNARRRRHRVKRMRLHLEGLEGETSRAW